MRRPIPRLLVVSLALWGFATASPRALAAPKDAAAMRLDKDAMSNDYLNVNFSSAESKLRKAIGDCGAGGCSAKAKALLHVHLGIVLINMGKQADGVAAFSAALRLEPNSNPEKDFTTVEVQRAFEEARGGLKRNANSPAATPATDSEEEDTEGSTPESKSSDGDLNHEPVREQTLRTPVPIYAQSAVPVSKVIVNYKPFGGDWKKLEMRKMGKGFGAEIPCQDVGVTGTLSYYLVAFDRNGGAIASASSKKDPYKVQIKQGIEGESPHLPGKSPPAPCKSKETCPPGINEPGCDGALSVGAKCKDTGQCDSALTCVEGLCQAGDDSSSTEEGALNWFHFVISPDFTFVSGTDICSRASQAAGSFSCFQSNGDQFKQNPATGHGGGLSGFAQFGTVRLLVGYDRAVTSNILVGTRVGYAFGGGPKPTNGNAFVPFHLEARATYYFGSNALTTTGVRPFAYLAGGLAQVDAKIPNVVSANGCNMPTRPDGQGCNPPQFTLDAWKKLGTSFVSAGGGITFALSKNSGFVLDARLWVFFIPSGFAFSPSLGYTQGF